MEGRRVKRLDSIRKTKFGIDASDINEELGAFEEAQVGGDVEQCVALACGRVDELCPRRELGKEGFELVFVSIPHGRFEA